MIISETHKFIFLRVTKTASTSVANYLIDNFVTFDDTFAMHRHGSLILNHIGKDLPDNLRTVMHLTMEEVIDLELVDKERLDEYYCFNVIRDPLERCLSIFFFHNTDHSVSNFRHKFRNGYYEGDENFMIKQSDFFNVDGINIADHWDYDHLTQRLETFVDERGLPVTKPFSEYREKSHFRKNRNPELIDYYFDKKTMSAVREYFEKDFELYQELKNEDR